MMLNSVVVFVLVFCCVSSLGKTLTIRNKDDFSDLVKSVKEGDFSFDIVLETDLDFSDGALGEFVDSLPLGYLSSSSQVPFTGVFDGKGFAIKNLVIDDEKRVCSGLFFNASNAVFKNIIIDESCFFCGTVSAGLSCEVGGNIAIENVNVSAVFRGARAAGGMIGEAIHVSDISVTVTNSEFRGRIDVKGTDKTSEQGFGGFLGYFLEVDRSQVRIVGNKNLGVFDAISDITSYSSCIVGGYMGISHGSNFTVIAADNIGSLQMRFSTQSTVHAGGVFGAVVLTGGEFSAQNNSNHFNISVSSHESFFYFGGIVPYLNADGCPLTMKNNVNDGEFKSNLDRSSISAGGLAGMIFQYKELVFESNTNNISFYVDAENVKECVISGFVASMALWNNFSFVDNTNNGHTDVRGDISKLTYGGLVSLFEFANPYFGGFVNNTNNGNVKIHTSQNESNDIYAGGLFGHTPGAPPSESSLCNFFDNTNNGLIEGIGANVLIGGFFGRLDLGSSHFRKLSLKRNVNNGLVTGEQGDGKQGFVAGLIGFLNADLNITDSSNYGGVIGQMSCGLACTSEETLLDVRNCVNNATIKGDLAYGIAPFVNSANNVVSIGTIDGADASFTFWGKAADPVSSLYGIRGFCENCGTDITIIEKNNDDGRFHSVNDDSVVDVLLNAQVEENGYSLRWDHSLVLRTNVTIHVSSPLDMNFVVLKGAPLGDNYFNHDLFDTLFQYHFFKEGTMDEIINSTVVEEEIVLEPYFLIKMSGAVDESFYVRVTKNPINLCDTQARQYLESAYLLGDRDSNTKLYSYSKVLGNMNIIVMIKHHVVMMEMVERILPGGDFNATELADEMNALAGIDKRSLFFDIKIDKQGFIQEITVFLTEEETKKLVVDAVNGMPKGTSCNYNILCNVYEAYALDPSSSAASSNGSENESESEKQLVSLNTGERGQMQEGSVFFLLALLFLISRFIVFST